MHHDFVADEQQLCIEYFPCECVLHYTELAFHRQTLLPWDLNCALSLSVYSFTGFGSQWADGFSVVDSV